MLRVFGACNWYISNCCNGEVSHALSAYYSDFKIPNKRCTQNCDDTV